MASRFCNCRCVKRKFPKPNITVGMMMALDSLDFPKIPTYRLPIKYLNSINCCDATLVSPVRRDGSPIVGAPERDGVALLSAQRRKLARYPELARGGPHRLCVLAAEIGRGWNDDSQHLVQRLVALRAHRALPRCDARHRRVGRDAGGRLARRMRCGARHLDHAAIAQC